MKTKPLSYCQATVPANSYIGAHRCEKTYKLQKVGRKTYCFLHAAMKRKGLI